MPTVTDWLMVGITIIYVVATIAIWRANMQSANATKMQLTESKREYEETKRLEMMPYLQFEAATQRGDYILHLAVGEDASSEYKLMDTFRVANIGNGTAKEIEYIWHNYVGDYERGQFSVNALRAGEEKNISIYFYFPQIVKTGSDSRVGFTFSYKDLLDNSYTQKVELVFGISERGISCTERITYPPKFKEREKQHA